MSVLEKLQQAGIPARYSQLDRQPVFEPDPSALFLVFMNQEVTKSDTRWKAVGLWRIRHFFDLGLVDKASLNKFLFPLIEAEKQRLEATRVETLKMDEVHAIIDGTAKGFVAKDMRNTDFSQVSYTEIG